MKKMTNKIVCALAALCFAVVFMSCGGSKVTKALDAYEKVVVQVEKAAEKGKVEDLAKFAAKAEDAEAKLSDLDNEEWTDAEEDRKDELDSRLIKASSKAASSALDGLGSFGF